MSSKSDLWFSNLRNIINFNKNEQAIILLTLTILVSSLFFLFDKINKSNILVMIFGLTLASLLGFTLARYYFNKDRQLQKREHEERRNKSKNEFEHYLRKTHVKISQEIDRPVENIVPRFSLRRLDALLTETIQSFKNFDPTDMASDKELHNALMLIKKHSEALVSDNTIMIDLKLALSHLEKVGEKYHIDLTPA